MIEVRKNFNIKRAVSGYRFLSSRDYKVLTDAFKTICKKLESDATLELYLNKNNTTSDLRRLFDEHLELFISDFIDFTKSDDEILYIYNLLNVEEFWKDELFDSIIFPLVIEKLN